MRPIGFESTVNAVRPSISSDTLTLAVQAATRIERTIIRFSPQILSIFTSSPSVKSGIYTKATSANAPNINTTWNNGWLMASFAVTEATAITFGMTSRNSR